jgi:signal peptidase I
MPVGSIAVVVPVDPATVRVGDVITYAAPTPGHPTVTHRVVEVVEPGSHPVLRTRGDANETPDPWTAQLANGPAWRRVAVVPHAGSIIRFLRSGAVHHATVQVTPLLLLVVILMGIWFPGRSGLRLGAGLRAGLRLRTSRLRLSRAPLVAAVALVFYAVAVPALATFTKAVSASSTITADTDWTAPTVSTTTIAKATGYLAGSVKQNGSYYVYANVTDTGNPASGMTGTPPGTVTADATALGGANNVALSTTSGPWSVQGQSYSYRSALLPAANPLAAGAKTYSITSTDHDGNSRQQTNFPVTVDNTAPTAFDVQTTGDGDGNAEQGETITYTFSEEIDPESILAGWNGASTNVQVQLIDGNLILFLGAADTVRIFNSAGSAQLPFGDLTLPGAGYNVGVLTLPGTTMVFSPSTMVKSAGSNTITITLGPLTAGSPDPGQSGAMTWNSTTTPYDAAGNTATGNAQTESGASDKEF